MNKVTGFRKLWPQLRPKWIIVVALILITIAQVKVASQGFFMG
jgi:hypothetical protein